ncbi:hypothetical protein OBBRIDRAFT_808801, partial [Obba rivulosa]
LNTVAGVLRRSLAKVFRRKPGARDTLGETQRPSDDLFHLATQAQEATKRILEADQEETFLDEQTRETYDHLELGLITVRNNLLALAAQDDPSLAVQETETFILATKAKYIEQLNNIRDLETLFKGELPDLREIRRLRVILDAYQLYLLENP